MRIVLLIATLAACGGKADAPAASGSLVFDPPATGATDVFLATEAEVLKSQPIRDRVKDRLHLDAAIAPESVVAAPKPGTLILDVGIRDADPHRAAELCNQLIQTYIEYRMERALVPLLEEQQALAEQADKHPEDAKLRERLAELELARSMRKLDVRVLDACRPATASRQ